MSVLGKEAQFPFIKDDCSVISIGIFKVITFQIEKDSQVHELIFYCRNFENHACILAEFLLNGVWDHKTEI